jgi:hypothetical protein
MATRGFTVLQEETLYIPSRTTEVRKALKKLREIDALKDKTMHTPEELDKLALETYWKNILDPPDTKADAEIKRKAKQYARHQEKEAKKEARRLVEEERVKKQNDERLKRELDEMARKKQRQDEYERQRADRQQTDENNRRANEEKMKSELEQTYRENRFKQQYIDEFATAVGIYKSPDRAFRKLSLKYHPDKNQENSQEAEKIQKILGEIREQYVR